jgi:RNA polymerase sigma-70 factor (ECF subfamily)
LTVTWPDPQVASAPSGRQGVDVEGVVTVPDLLERARDGDISAFAQFYDQEAEALLRWFRRRTAAADVAGDLCAETFAKTLANLDRYHAAMGSAPTAWLYGIAKNEFRSWLRHQRVEDRGRQQLGLRVTSPEADEFDLVELRVDLERRTGPLEEALATLSGPVREAVELRVVHELPYRLVAERLDCSEGAARVRVSRGLAQLLDHLIDEDGADG